MLGVASQYICALLSSKHFTLAQIFRWPVAIQKVDLLAPRRQERQVTGKACHPERMRGI